MVAVCFVRRRAIDYGLWPASYFQETRNPHFTMTQKNKKNAATTEVSQEGVQTDRNGTVEAPADAVSEPAASAAETAPATDISGEEAGASFSGSEAPEASDRTSDKKPAATAKDPACTTKTPARGSGTRAGGVPRSASPAKCSAATPTARPYMWPRTARPSSTAATPSITDARSRTRPSSK